MKMKHSLIMVKKRIWDLILLYAMANGYGAILFMIEKIRLWSIRMMMHENQYALAEGLV